MQRSPTIDSQLAKQISAEIDTWLQTDAPASPSLVFGIFDRDGMQLCVGSGNVNGQAPNASTIYRIASMSKSFTAATMLLLAERGSLGLCDEVRMYVPDFPDYVDETGTVVPVQLWMLLANCSGLPHDNAWADQLAGRSEAFLRKQLRAGLSYSAAPGTCYQYSNLGFAVLGLVVSAATGRPFTELATRELLTPLGLASTHWDTADYPDTARLQLATGFETYDGGEHWEHRPNVPTGMMAPAGSLYSNAADIARWCNWLAAAFDRQFGDDSVLSRAARRRMQCAHTLIPSMEDRMNRPDLDGIGYGFGLIVEHSHRYGVIAQHSGGLPGFSSHMRWHHETGVGVVVLGNTNGLPTAQWGKRLLERTLDGLDAPARTVQLWPETRAAAAALDRSICESAGLSGATTHIDENVYADIPQAVREQRLNVMIDQIGGITPNQAPLHTRMGWAASPAHLAWRIRGRSGELNCEVELTPLASRKIQRIELNILHSQQPGELVAYRYRPEQL